MIKFRALLFIFLTRLGLFQQEAIRTDGPVHKLLLFLFRFPTADANQPVLILIMFLSVLRVDTILQNHNVPLPCLLGSKWFGVISCFRDERRRVNPPAIHLTWAWLLKYKQQLEFTYIFYFNLGSSFNTHECSPCSLSMCCCLTLTPYTMQYLHIYHNNEYKNLVVSLDDAFSTFLWGPMVGNRPLPFHRVCAPVRVSQPGIITIFIQNLRQNKDSYY